MEEGQIVQFGFVETEDPIKGKIVGIDNNFITIEDENGQTAYNVQHIMQIKILEQPPTPFNA